MRIESQSDATMQGICTPGRESSCFFQDLVALLQNPHFQYVRQAYMRTWTDAETLFMYIFLCEMITLEYRRRYGATIAPERLVSILRQIFQDTMHRRAAVSMFREYQTVDQPIEQFIRRQEQSPVPRLPSSIFMESIV